VIGRELALAQDARHGRAYPVGDSGVRNPPRAAPPLARVGEREVTGRGMKWWVVLATATVLIGCDSPGPLKPPVAPPQPLLAPPVVNPADPLRIESGAKLTLRVPLAFPAGANALYLQNNQLVSAAGVVPELPYCRLTPTSAAAPRVLEPGTVTIGSVDYDEKELGPSGTAAMVTRIALVDPRQSRYAMSCQWPEGGPARAFLTAPQIQGAIGAFFSMALAP